MAQAVERLPSKCEALSSNSIVSREREREREREKKARFSSKRRNNVEITWNLFFLTVVEVEFVHSKMQKLCVYTGMSFDTCAQETKPSSTQCPITIPTEQKA
jgi:hypothetical protein